MQNYAFIIILFISNLVFFSFFLKIARKIGFIDKSNKFNNPITITSAGVIIYINLLIIFFVHILFKENFIKDLPNNFLFTLIALSILVLISTADDLKPIDPKIRLIFQLICIYFSITSIPIYEINLPIKLSIFICLCTWVYILNITNFTDGSDGFLAINTIAVFLNLIILDNLFNLNIFSAKLMPYLLPSLIVFCFLNKPSAKIYMGDSGSILIGFINGFMFLELMTANMLNIVISLLVYPILDCSLALVKKTLQGKMPWVDTSNYSFLQPIIKKNHNKFFISS